MPKNKLGLPIEYQKRPEYFDAHNVSDAIQTANGVIESILKRHLVKTVLDLTCGTGSQVFFLNSRGYRCTGSDFSPALIEQAQQRARNENFDISFIDGDMRTIKVGTFDAVITISNAVGHLSKAGFSKTMKNVHHNLKSGGIYVFDIFNLEAMTDQVVANFAYYVEKKTEESRMFSIQCSTIDRNNGRLTSYDNYVVQKGAEKPECFKNTFALQLYTAAELREMLAKNGFEVLGQYGMDGAEFLEKKTISILTVARKK